jgi:hypothetical protein
LHQEQLRLLKSLLTICLLSSVSLAFGQTSLPSVPASIQKQRDAIKKQLESVRHQVESTKGLGTPMSDFIDPFPALPTAALAQANCPALAADQADEVINAAAQQHSLDPKLIRAVIKQESGLKPCALSVKGAQGLMQLMPETAARFKVADPFDPKQNVMGGSAYLKELMNKYQGNIKLALSAYNAGPARTDAAGDVPDIAETQNYVSSIMADLGVKDPQPPAVAATAPSPDKIKGPALAQ